MNSESTNEVNNELNLWPSDLTDFQVKSPVDILKEQAILLGQTTGNLITGKVFLLKDLPAEEDTHEFIYKFSVESGVIGYKYHLFSIGHNFELYPVTFLDLNDEIIQELSGYEHEKLRGKQHQKIEAKSEKDFTNLLKRIFQSKKAKIIIRGILAQARTKKKYDPFSLDDIPF